MAGEGRLEKDPKEKQRCKGLQHLPQEIEKLKTELNLKVTQNGEKLNNEETLELSQRLDELIVNHLLNELDLLGARQEDEKTARVRLCKLLLIHKRRSHSGRRTP